jgi:hypothetical protein
MNLNLFERVVVPVVYFSLFCFIIAFVSGRAAKKSRRLHEQFIEEESEANATRKKAIDLDLFYTPDVTSLPVREGDELTDPAVERRQGVALKQAGFKMVRLPKGTKNLELKHSYGLANLELVASYEENFNKYLFALLDWAEALLNTGGVREREDAVILLEKTADYRAEYSKVYKYLADHYIERGETDRVAALIPVAEAVFSDDSVRQQVVQYLMEKKAVAE